MCSPLLAHSQTRVPGAGTGACTGAPSGASGRISSAASFTRGGDSGVGASGDVAAATIAAGSRGEGSKAAIPMAMAVVAAMSVPTSHGK